MDIVSNIAIISINETVIVQIISFVIFVLIINRTMFRPLNSVRKERVDYMDGLKQDTIDAEEEVIRLTDQLRDQENKARAEALSQKKEIEDSGNAEAKDIYAEAKNEIMGLKNKATKEVEDQIQEAMQYLQTEAENLATGIMEKVLNRRLA